MKRQTPGFALIDCVAPTGDEAIAEVERIFKGQEFKLYSISETLECGVNLLIHTACWTDTRQILSGSFLVARLLASSAWLVGSKEKLHSKLCNFGLEFLWFRLWLPITDRLWF